MDNPLIKAINYCDGIAPLAAGLNCIPSKVSMWKARDNVPPEYWKSIEEVTKGHVTRQHFLEYLDFKTRIAA